jgi:hypothetical protein
MAESNYSGETMQNAVQDRSEDVDILAELVAEKVVAALHENRLPVSFMNDLNGGGYIRFALPCVPGKWYSLEVAVTPDREAMTLTFLNDQGEMVNRFRIFAGNV